MLQSRGRAGRRSAAVLVEFALVATFLSTMMIGIVELGRGVMVRCILTDAARKGCATGVAANKTYTDISNDADDILNTDQQLPATIANGKATLTVYVATWNASTQTYGSDTAVTSATFAPKQYDKVTVKVSVHASDVTWFFLKFLTNDLESESVVMMRQS
jgi:Flp pilus assembly protein TadG